MKTTIKTTALCLMLGLFASACSRKSESRLFVISAEDVSAAPVLMPTGSTEGIVEVHLHDEKSAEWATFWPQDPSLPVQVAVVVAKPESRRGYTGNAIQLHFATVEQAEVVADLLDQRPRWMAQPLLSPRRQ